MQVSASAESRMKRIIQSYHFKSRGQVVKVIDYFARSIEKHGPLSFLEVIDFIDDNDIATGRDYITWTVFDKGRHYGWTSVESWAPACEKSMVPGKTYWRINASFPRRISEDSLRYPGFKKGDRIYVKEYGINPDNLNNIDHYNNILTWNSVKTVGRHIPDYCEFVAEYPTFVEVRAHFENNDGKSYVDAIPVWALRAGRVMIKHWEDD